MPFFPRDGGLPIAGADADPGPARARSTGGEAAGASIGGRSPSLLAVAPVESTKSEGPAADLEQAMPAARREVESTLGLGAELERLEPDESQRLFLAARTSAPGAARAFRDHPAAADYA